ncbi:hypothetical protein OROGR_007787 [Orobanche gracilis]
MSTFSDTERGLRGWRRVTDRSAATLPTRTNGLDASIDSSASLSIFVNINGSVYLNKPRYSWWNNHSKDRFAPASGIMRYSFKYDEEQVLSWQDRLQIAVDISHGIEYLHDGAVPPVVHRDLKSANILLDNSMRAKVADFGLSKEQVFDGHSSGLKAKSDVYSFGIILFELITAIHPHHNLMEYAAMSPEGVDEISKIVGTCNVEEMRNVAEIAHRCLHQTPRKGPLMGEVSQSITKIKQRHLVKEDTMMSFAGEDYSRAVILIESQQLELGRMVSIDQRQSE